MGPPGDKVWFSISSQVPLTTQPPFLPGANTSHGCGFEASSFDARSNSSRRIAVVHGREDIVHALEVVEQGFVQSGGGELFVEGKEAEEVVFDAFGGVIRAGAGAEDERPVAGLSEEEFAAGLFQRAELNAARPGKFMGQF